MSARFLALGDSYTIGEGVAADECWPVQLVRALRARGHALDDPDIIAQTGWTTDELERGITTRDPHGPFALVTLLIGVNDQYRGRALPGFRIQLGALMDRAVAFASGDARRTIAISIPDWGVTRFAEGRDREEIAMAIDAFNAAVRTAASRTGAHFADVTALTRAFPGDVVADGLHPNREMYAAWAATLAPIAESILRQPESTS